MLLWSCNRYRTEEETYRRLSGARRTHYSESMARIDEYAGAVSLSEMDSRYDNILVRTHVENAEGELARRRTLGSWGGLGR